MTTKFKTRQEVADKIEAEGLDYFILYYATPDMMPDKALANYFARANKSLNDFVSELPDPSDSDDGA